MNVSAAIDKLRIALQQGDASGARAMLTRDADLYVPGRSGLSGPYRGREAVIAFMEKLVAVTGGTFRFDVERVLADERLALVLGRAAWKRHDEARSAPAVLVVSFAVPRGQIAEIRVFRHDQPGLDEPC